jgi:hypothetical protein
VTQSLSTLSQPPHFPKPPVSKSPKTPSLKRAMPFDPNYPPANAEILSAPLRDQFNGLKDLIDTVPTLNAAQVDGVTPLPPGSAPAASVSVSGNTLHFTFDLPVSISSVVVDSVSSVGPSDPASVSATLIGEVLHLSFSIPRGFDGAAGAAGAPGEVSNAALASAIGGTSSNSNGVGTLDTPFADPDDEALRGKMNELIAALRRL